MMERGTVKRGKNYILRPGVNCADLAGAAGCIVSVLRVDDEAGTALVSLPHRLPPRWIDQQYLEFMPANRWMTGSE